MVGAVNIWARPGGVTGAVFEQNSGRACIYCNCTNQENQELDTVVRGRYVATPAKAIPVRKPTTVTRLTWPTVRFDGAEEVLENGDHDQRDAYVGNGGAFGPTIFLRGTTFSALPVSWPIFILGRLSMLQAFL